MSYKKQQFPFLSQPPPPLQKKRPSPSIPLPPTPPHASSAILAWASHVQPGSPAPNSPQRRPSISSTSSRRPSISRLGRRPSISHGRSPANTPSVGDFDLTALGYTSVFVHLPKTPTTPSPYLRQYNLKHNREEMPPVPPTLEPPKRKGMRRFRSLSILRPRSSKTKSQAAPPSPTKTTASAKPSKPSKKAAAQKLHPLSPSQTASTSHSKAEVCAATIAKRKRAKYAYVRPPPPLANELAMMQFADGGSLESHVKRVMEHQAKMAAGSGAAVGVADVYRDGKGGIWWDADEEMEYAHLLGGATVQDVMKDGRDALEAGAEMEWEAFDADAAEPLAPFLLGHTTTTVPAAATAAPAYAAAASTHDLLATPDSRRSSISTQDSDLDPKYLLPLPENEDPRHAVDDRILASRRIGGPGMSVLSLPSRPRRAAMHLSKPATFLVDAAAFGPRSPAAKSGSGSGSGSESAPTTELTSANERQAPSASSATSTSTTTTTTSTAGTKPKPRGKARRRPAPLKLANSAHAVVVVVRRSSSTRAAQGTTTASAPPTHIPTPTPASGHVCARTPVIVAPSHAPAPASAAVVLLPSPRREFIENSFAPTPPLPVAAVAESLVVATPLNSAAVASAIAPVLAPAAAAKLAKPSRLGMRGLFSIGSRKGAN
ncbi:hypothetical protein BDZ97DRAFT_2075380 [Flammula alnicola]|nr:hypothetical protein BDZ97DRAFT_2075380 [Flammula alnicola]